MRHALPLLFACLLWPAHAADWQPFHWHTGSVDGGPVERLAIVLPITVDGIACNAQLDTGANEAVIWHGQAPAVAVATPAAAQPRKVLVEFAGLRSYASAAPAVLAQLTSDSCKIGVIATLGNAFFEQGTLTLDLGGARVAYAPQSLLANDPNAQPLFYARWASTGGHTLVEVAQADQPAGYALLDTGSARFGLNATSAAEWATLTNNTPLHAGDKVRKYSIRSWGRDIDCYESRAAGDFTVGKQPVAAMQASYCVDQGFRAPVRLIGVLGLKPLGDRVLTIDYPGRRWKLAELASPTP